jgi:V/A-type H+-transporting ATPase subunit I
MIGKIKKFSCFFIGDPDILLNKLQKFGIVEIENMTFEDFKTKYIQKEEVENRIKKIEFLKDILEREQKWTEKIFISEKEEKEIIEKFPLDEIYQYSSNILQEIERRKKIISKIEKIEEEIKPLLDTEIIFSDIFSLSKFSFFVFSLPEKIKIKKEIEDVYIERICKFQKEDLYLALFRSEKKEIVEEFLRKTKAKILYVRKWNKKIKDVFKKISYLKKKNGEIILNLKNELLLKIAKYKKEIFVIYDYYKSFYEFLRAKEKIGISKFLNGIKGWIREKDVKVLKGLVDEVYPENYLIIEEPTEKDDVPIILENTKIIEPFEIVTDLYGRPVYKNIDPTGPLSLFFAISFGFCLIIISSFLIKKFRFLPNFVKFSKLLLICGISTLIIGALTGGWFGDIIYKVSEDFKFIKFLKKMVILNPLEGGDKAVNFLLITLVIGYIQILWGLILNLYNQIKNYSIKHSGEGICLLLIQSIVAFIILIYIKTKKVPPPLLAILLLSFIYLMFEKAKTQKELMLKGFWAIYGVYSVISGNLLADILSYSRLFGLGLTTSVLALAINQIVSLTKNIPYVGLILGMVIFLIGHFGNLLINLLGSYVHTSRLQYLEFFTKFFESGGRVFKPFKEVRGYTVKSDLNI